MRPEEQVVLVNERDEEIGTMGKLKAHELGLLHRAFSIFLFDDNGRLLLQQRAAGKYHSAGLWTNTCCSHPRPGEPLLAAAQRRLAEEMGISTPLEHRFSFLYKGGFDNGLTEHELDHVFFGRWNGPVRPDTDEVGDWRYMAIEALGEDMRRAPDHYTIWLRACWDQVCEHLAPVGERP
jgi:isopentenyl-diphosphate delta-isomerase